MIISLVPNGLSEVSWDIERHPNSEASRLSPYVFYNPENCHNKAEVKSKFIIYYLLPTLGAINSLETTLLAVIGDKKMMEIIDRWQQ